MSLINGSNPRKYRCDNCGKVDSWGDDWMWYGSIKDMEEGGQQTYCSESCAKEAHPTAQFLD